MLYCFASITNTTPLTWFSFFLFLSDPNGGHRVLGLIITVLMIVQPFLGQLANVMFDPM